MENAKKVIDICDNGKAFAEIADIVTDDAEFTCQADAMKDIKTVQGYNEWMAAFGSTTAPDFKVDIHNFSWNPEKKIATHFATFHCTHTGPGGPVEPTNKMMHTEYVYIVYMNDDDKCYKIHKVWNDGWAMRQVGWM